MPIKAVTALCSLLFFTMAAKAQGDLFVNPKRIVFENQKRSEDVSLANTGNDTARYVISFVQIKLKENGEFEQITQPDSGQYFADKNLRIFPRTVTLAPKETQIVKVQTYRKENLAAGEYRSHLYFRSLPAEKAAGDSSTRADSGQLSIKLKAVFGITIPVIIRVGENDTQVDLSELKFDATRKKEPFVSLQINRKGNMSVYGDLVIDYIAASGKITRAGFVKGISVYTPNLSRKINIALNSAQTIDFRSGQIQVSYTGTKNGKPVKFATALIRL